jgi:hypothetical protein
MLKAWLLLKRSSLIFFEYKRRLLLRRRLKQPLGSLLVSNLRAQD